VGLIYATALLYEEGETMEKNSKIKKLSKTNTKQEMLEAYNTLLQQLQEREKTELNPEWKQGRS